MNYVNKHNIINNLLLISQKYKIFLFYNYLKILKVNIYIN